MAPDVPRSALPKDFSMIWSQIRYPGVGASLRALLDHVKADSGDASTFRQQKSCTCGRFRNSSDVCLHQKHIIIQVQ